MANLGPSPEQGQDGDTAVPEFDQRRLTDELLKLRTREGLVFDRVKDCEELKAAARVWKQTQLTAIAKLDNASAAIEMVKQYLEDQRPVHHRDSLKVTYGLIVDGLSRDDRVRRYLELPKDQRTVSSEKSIMRYSQSMAAQLAIKLASITSSDPEPTDDDDLKMVTGLSGGELLSPLRVELRETITRFGPKRVFADTLILMHLVATRDGQHSHHAAREYYSDRAEDVIHIIPEYGCEAGEQIFEDGVAHLWLRIPRLLKKGDRHLLVYRIAYRTNKPAQPWLMNLTPDQDEARYALHMQFHQDSIPSEIWTFSHLAHYAARRLESRKQVRAPYDGSGFVSEEWYNLKAGLSYGVAWEWPSAD